MESNDGQIAFLRNVYNAASDKKLNVPDSDQTMGEFRNMFPSNPRRL